MSAAITAAQAAVDTAKANVANAKAAGDQTALVTANDALKEAEEALATAQAAQAANSTLYVNIGGDKYTSMKAFKMAYHLNNDAEATTLISMVDVRTGELLDITSRTGVEKKLIVDSLTFRKDSITRQLKDITNRPILQLQPLRSIKNKLSAMLVTLSGVTPTGAPGPDPSVVNLISQRALTAHLMSRLLKIGYFATHTDRIKTADIAAWNTLLDSMDALATTPGSLLNNATNPVNEAKTYPISTAALSNNKFKKVSEYITAMTTLSDSETAFTANVAAMLDAMSTYQFLEQTKRIIF